MPSCTELGSARSPGVSLAEENLEPGGQLIVDPETLLSHVRKDFQGIVNQCSALRFTEHSQCADQRKATISRNRATFPFVHDQDIRLAFDCQLNGFPLAAVEGRH